MRDTSINIYRYFFMFPNLPAGMIGEASGKVGRKRGRKKGEVRRFRRVQEIKSSIPFNGRAEISESLFH